MSVDRPPKSVVVWKSNPKSWNEGIHRTIKELFPAAADGTGRNRFSRSTVTAKNNQPYARTKTHRIMTKKLQRRLIKQKQNSPNRLFKPSRPRCWNSHPGMPEDSAIHDGESEDEPPALCEDVDSRSRDRTRRRSQRPTCSRNSGEDNDNCKAQWYK